MSAAAVTASAEATAAVVLQFFPALDRLLREAVEQSRRVYQKSQDDFRGLYISEEEVDALVDRNETIGSPSSASAFLSELEQLPGIKELPARWGLTAFDHGVILIALAPELDLRYERIYAYLQDDVTRRRPTVDLALSLLSESPSARMVNRLRFDAGSPLLCAGLLRLVADSSQTDPPLLAHSLKLDEAVIRMLAGDRSLDARLRRFCDLETKVALPAPDTDILRRLPAYVAAARGHRPVRLLILGSAGRATTATRTTAAAAQSPLLTADLTKDSAWHTDPATAALLLLREAQRHSAVLHIRCHENGDSAGTLAFLHHIREYDGSIVVTSPPPAVVAAMSNAGFMALSFPPCDYPTRLALWRDSLTAAGLSASATTLSALAGNFQHEAEQIEAAMSSATDAIRWKSAAGTLSQEEVDEELLRAARAQTGAELASLTAKLDAVYQWPDLVLPKDVLAQLDEICQRVTYRHRVLDDGGFGAKLSAGKGVAVLFAGPSGTGKTMAAEVIANRLGLDLFRIDLSTVVSKYIGDTEKNLERIFQAATRSNSVLLFDEADSLCGKRSEVRDAHDRYANIEISYLLQKMEQYEGITILTTNLRGNLDEAFVRRLAFTVHFPFPEEADRRRIWQKIWPSQTRLDGDVTFEALAKHFKLSGGNIKNIALATAFLAAGENRPVNMSDILHATRREYEKVGKVMSAAEIEAAVR